MSRVLLVDDEPQLVHALRRALEQADHEVVAAADGETGIEYAATTQPDLVVLDLKLPDVDGVEVVRRLRPWFEPPILILSAVTDEARKVQALDAGADDFLNKPFGVRELTARMRALLRRSGGSPEQRVLHFPDLDVDLAARTVRTGADDDLRLTPTEWRILEALVTQPGKLLTHRWLLHQVWDDSHGDEARQSLRSHMRSLRAKLGDDATAPRYVRTESGAGYRWLPMPDSEEDAAAVEPTTGDGTARGFEDVMHELNNVLTAMRFAAYLSKPRVESTPEEAAARLTELGTRWEALVIRASALAAELDQAR